MQVSEDVRYLRRKFHKNQSPIGIFLDALALRLLFFLAVLIFFRRRIPTFQVALLLSAISLSCFCILLHIINSLRYETFAVKTVLQLQQSLFSNRLWQLSDEKLQALVNPLLQPGETLFILRRIEPASGDDILNVARAKEQIALLSTSGFTATAQQLMQSCFPKLHLIDPKQLFDEAKKQGLLPSLQDVQKEMGKRYSLEKQKRRRAVSLAFSNTFPGKYFLTAGLLILLSFFTGYALYYRLLAMFSTIIALIGAVLSRDRQTHPASQQDI